MKTIKYGEDQELKIRATPLAVIIYEEAFGKEKDDPNLLGDWGYVEFSVNKYIEAQTQLEYINSEFEKLCKKYNIATKTKKNQEESFIKLVESLKGEDVENTTELLKQQKIAAEVLQKNTDIEMTDFLRILYALNIAQLRKEGEDEPSFKDWIIEHDEIKLFEVWEDIAEEALNLFSAGGKYGK